MHARVYLNMCVCVCVQLGEYCQKDKEVQACPLMCDDPTLLAVDNH